MSTNKRVQCSFVALVTLTLQAALLLGGQAAAQRGIRPSDPALVQPKLVSVPLTVPPQFDALYTGSRNFNLPAGFQISLFAVGIANGSTGTARMMSFGACGDLFVGTLVFYNRSGADKVYRLPDRDGNGVADVSSPFVFASGLPSPAHSVEYWNGRYYVGAGDGVYRYEQADCDSAGSNQQKIVDLPGTGYHISRTPLHGPDGKLYVSVGSSNNAIVETNPHYAAVLRYDSEGGNEEVWANGLRNAVGLAFRPGTGDLWATDNGVDHLGGGQPSDELDLIQPGRYYGWPYCYNDGIVDTSSTANALPNPPGGKTRAQYCASSTNPLLKLPAHSAPLGLTFSKDTSLTFPTSWKQGLFVALRVNSGGARLIYIPYFAPHGGGGRWQPPLIDFMTAPAPSQFKPVGMVIGPDNALYVSNQYGGVIYRITYPPPPADKPDGRLADAKPLMIARRIFMYVTAYRGDGRNHAPPLS